MLSMTKTLLALLWGAFGTLMFTFVYASSKLTGGEISAFQIMLIRYISGFVGLLLIVGFSKSTLKNHKSTRPQHHLYRSITGSMGGICIIHASYLSPIADVTALSLTDGIMTVLLSVWFLGEVVGKKQWAGGILCAFGAFVIVYGSSDGSLFDGFSIGLWFALLGALLISIESILIKVLTNSEKPMTILLHVNFYSTIILLIPALYSWTTLDLMQLTFFIALGPIAICAQYCWVKAYSLEDVSIVTPINYTWIVFAAVLGYFFFDEKLGAFTIVGSALIVIGGIVLAKVSKLKSEPFKNIAE